MSSDSGFQAEGEKKGCKDQSKGLFKYLSMCSSASSVHVSVFSPITCLL